MNRISDSMDSTSTLIEEPNIRTESFLSECHQVMDVVGEGAFGHVTKYFCIKTCEMEAIEFSSFRIVHVVCLKTSWLWTEDNSQPEFPGSDEHRRDVNLTSSSRQPVAQSGLSSVVQLTSDLDVGVQLKTSSTHSGYGHSIGNINFISRISSQGPSPGQGAHVKSVFVDLESGKNIEYNQPDTNSQKHGLFTLLVGLLTFACFFPKMLARF